MSGCCGQGPVIVTGAASSAPRVDVEAVVLCDVLADGTVAATVLVEPIYDASSGARIGTRIVDPATGTEYTPTGTLTACGAPAEGGCARQITVRTRCDDTTGDGTGDTTYAEVWALDPCDGGAPLLLGSYQDGDFTQPYTPVSPVDCPEPSTDTPVVLGSVCYDAGGGTVRTAAVLKCAGCADTAVTYLDVETGATVAAPTLVPCVDPTSQVMDVETWPLCVLNTDGTVLQHVRAEQVYDAQGAPSGPPRIVDAVTGGPVAVPGGATLGVCPDSAPCASPTTPLTSIGLCLADGTPIAVTATRDCTGTVTSGGWINLTTGAWSAGQPPAGTVACGDSRSVQVSGTFCDVDPNGKVLGLVLVEYSYAADGTIASVRLVDATTGTTYTPQGEITTCPAGTEQPEQDIVQLCDVQADGTVTPFVRDYRRDETGAVTGHSDYTLDGAAYQPTGTVGVCEPPRSDPADVETFPLCLLDDTTGDVVQNVRAEVVYDDTGTRTALRFVDPVTGAAVTPGAGQHLAVCPSPDPCAKTVIERCGCDDTTGDGIGDVTYTELWAVDPCNGAAPQLLGTYEGGDFAKPYTPTAPVDCTASEDLDGEPLLLCDSGTPFLRHIRYDAGTPVSVLDTALDGITAYTVTGTVGACTQPPTPDTVVNTGLNRLTAGTFDVKAATPGLQSATVTVLAGTAQVTTSSGTVTIPAGLSLTWSVSDDDDSSLSALSVTAPAGADVVTSYTYKATEAGI